MGIIVPPIEKIHEAYSAIVDNRVVLRDMEADVSSSDYSKTYLVTWENETYTSNDNASYWKGYPGYPIIAVLMLQGKLPFDRKIAGYFKGINWKELNTQHNNNYSEVVKQIMEEFELDGIDCDKINAEIAKVYEEIGRLTIATKRSPHRPPRERRL